MREKLSIGDLIECEDKEEMVNVSCALAAQDILTDFVFELNGVDGTWLKVTSMDPIEIKSVEEVKQLMCDDYCRYTHGFHGDIEEICSSCLMNYLEE